MVNGFKQTLQKCIVIPHRYILGIMGFLAVVNAYTMRISLSVAITEMVKPTHNGTTSRIARFRSSIINEDELYDWSEEVQGLILGAFYWGYVITHMPGGILAEKFGGKYSLGLGILSTAIFTLLTPWVVEIGGWQGLVALRVLEGLGEGTTYPALNALLSKWVPISERAKIGTLVYAGGQIGTVVGNAASGFIIESTGTWSSVFYLFGVLGIIWFIVWVLLCYSEPESHPFISDDEKNYLRKELGGNSKDKAPIPWKAIFTSVPLWALVVAQIGHDWGFFTMVTDLPKYMKDVLGLGVSENGVMSSVPYIVMWVVSMSSGWLCDWLINNKYMGITFARKFFTAIAAIIPGIFIVAASYAGTDQTVVVTLFTIGMGFMGTFYCGMKVNALDLASNYGGTIMAIVNGIGAITGIITPYLVGVIVTEGGDKMEQWRIVFWITLGVFIVTTIVYVLFASGEEQWWNNPDKHTKDSTNKDIEAVYQTSAPTTPRISNK